VSFVSFVSVRVLSGPFGSFLVLSGPFGSKGAECAGASLVPVCTKSEKHRTRRSL